MQVIKIGGALMNNPSKLKIAANILRTYQNENVLVVISAFGKTTRNLINTARIAETGNSKTAISALDEIIDFHIGSKGKSIALEAKEKLIELLLN